MGEPRTPRRPRPSGQPQPYASSREHLLAALARMDLLVRMQAARARTANGGDAFRGLAISDAEIDTLLARSAGVPPWEAAPPLDELEVRCAALAVELDERTKVTLAAGTALRLVQLERRFGLEPFDRDALLIALLPELESRFERLFAYLHDDVTRKRPSVELVTSLLTVSFDERVAGLFRFAAGAPLQRFGLVRLTADGAAPRLTHAIKLDERIADFLIDSDELDARLQQWAQLAPPPPPLDQLGLPGELIEQLTRSLSGSRAPVMHLSGPDGAGRATLAAALCAEHGAPLVILDGAGLLAAGDTQLETLLPVALRETRLLRAGLLVRGVDALLADGQESALRRFVRAIENEPAPIFLAGEQPWRAPLPRGRSLHQVTMPPLPSSEQAILWRRALDAGPPLDDVDLVELAGRFRLRPGGVNAAAAAAGDLARFRDGDAARVSLTDLTRACRQHAQPRLGSLAQRVGSRCTWDDLVLQPQSMQRLREIAEQARHRRLVLEEWGFEARLATGRGLGVLFAGPPGTGKTLAASIIANELGLDLYRIDLASVVSKYIGETEKQLAQLFDEAERSRAILFFDEADALFGKRTEIRDAHDRYANIGTSYLLQRMDAFEGTVILASNLRRNMDEAFVRRLRFVIEFANPDANERRRIWERVFPAGVPRAPDLDFGVMSDRFDLPGGYIRNMALAAAFFAASDGGTVELAHLMRAARREYQNLGKMIDESHFAEP